MAASSALQWTEPVKRERYYLAGSLVVEHMPLTAPPLATAILLLPPMGSEDTRAYRPLRILADALAATGHAVLRLDWPGLGDSALDAYAADLVERQVAAASAAAESLRDRGFPRVAAIGVRAGGLIALAADGLDEIALWGTPSSGKAYLREQVVFHKMVARCFGELPADAPPLPDGAIEAGGFVYSAQTAGALNRLDAVSLAADRRFQRALVISQKGMEPPATLLQALTDAGTDVAVAKSEGLGMMLQDPYRAALAPDAETTIRGWLAHPGDRVQPRPAAGDPRLELPGGATERPWVLQGQAGEMSGIVCEPPGGAAPGAAWTIFLNAGGVRRSGPNRLWTQAARELAAQGRPSLRFDVRSIGDSDGATIPHDDFEEIYSEDSVQDALLAYDWVRAQRAGDIDVAGLCSGAFLGMQTAARRPVRRAVLFNGLVFVWNDDARASSMTSQIRGSLLDSRRWTRLLTGKIGAVALAKSIAAKTYLTLRDAVRRGPPRDEVNEIVRDVVGRGTRLHLVSSEGDPSIAYLKRHVPALGRPQLTVLPSVDHTIRPVWAHRRVVDLLTGSTPDP
jgi:alpha/beta superfamily hydrolase